MKKRAVFFTPGPTNLEEEVIKSFQEDQLHHRSKYFRKFYPQICEKLKKVFKSELGETLTLTGSGTLALDAGLASMLNPGDKVLVLSNGYFGERFILMAKKYGLDVVELKQTWMSKIDIVEFEQVVKANTDLKAVLVVHCETSTGQLQDIEAIGKITNQANLLLIVDAISGLLFNDFEFDAWHVDYAVSSSQKGFGLPPGLAFVCMSKRAIERLKDDNLNYYISLKDNLEFKQDYGSTPSTPAVLMLQALDVVLDKIIEDGLDSYQKRGAAMINYICSNLIPLGFKPIINIQDQAKGVLALYVPDNLDINKLQEYLFDKFAIYVEKGIEQLSKKIIRIGVMSKVSNHELENLINGIKQYLNY